MKIAPIVRQLKRRSDRFEFRIIHTGQHYDQSMSDVFFRELDIPAPDYYLEVGGGTHAEQTAKIMMRFEDVCLDHRPDLILVVGDVNSTLACAVVAKKLHITLGHVEAGLRSGDRDMPEEINRLVTDSISDLFFVTEPSGIHHLRREGHKEESIHFVGHVMIDNLLHQLKRIERSSFNLEKSNRIKNNLDRYAVTTLHRPSNVDSRENLSKLVDILSAVAERIPLIFPVHPRTRRNLDAFNLQLDERIIQLDPLPYMDFLNCFREASFVLTDSGGLQEETTALGIPCITLRKTTERPVTVSEGTNRLVALQSKAVADEVDRILNNDRKSGTIPRFWDGKAAERILNVLEKQLSPA